MDSFIVPCPSCGTKNKVPAHKQHLTPKCGSCKEAIDLKPFARPVTLTDQDFQTIIDQASLPVLVDFYSPTCGPCQMMAPVIDNLARQYHGRLLVAKLDTSVNQMTAGRFQIRGVPTLLLMKNGQVMDQVVGAMPETALVQKINQFVG